VSTFLALGVATIWFLLLWIVAYSLEQWREKRRKAR
jgi:hypothetical protein